MPTDADQAEPESTTKVNRWELLRQRGEEIQRAAQEHGQQQRPGGTLSVATKPPAPKRP